ncbi:MAG: phytanoyl-CoA dioxygenase [Saprospiraceae bacterium]
MSGIAQALLGPDGEFLAISGAIKQFFELLMDITRLEPGNDVHREHLILPSGKCIGPYWAALCVKDLMRTKKFVQGLYLGIRAAQQKFPDTTLHVLYAGTGPFATLALPMTALFSPEEVQFTMLEIQPESVRMLHQVIDAFQMGAYVREVLTVDATQYQCPPDQRPHVLICETMQHSLRDEPQVAITMNLAPQLQPGGILIPEQILVWAGFLDKKLVARQLFDLESPRESAYLLKQLVFTLDKQTPEETLDHGWFPAIEIEISPEESARYQNFYLFTQIQVYGAASLQINQSGLNLPHALLNFQRMTEPPNRVVLQYGINGRPGFQLKQHIAPGPLYENTLF